MLFLQIGRRFPPILTVVYLLTVEGPIPSFVFCFVDGSLSCEAKESDIRPAKLKLRNRIPCRVYTGARGGDESRRLVADAVGRSARVPSGAGRRSTVLLGSSPGQTRMVQFVDGESIEGAGA